MKEKQVQDQMDCLATGKCPLYAPKVTEGRRNCVDGLAGDKPCRNVDQLSYTSIQDLGYSVPTPDDNRPRGNDIWGWTDPVNGDEYVVIGLSGGSSFVRVTDPENPVVLGFLYSRNDVSSSWRDMKVVNDHAFIVSEAAGHGMQVVDMTQFRGKTDFSIIQADALYSEFGNAHNIVSNEATGYVYVVGDTDLNYEGSCAGGLHMIDVSDPKNPRNAGCFADDGYVHDAQCVVYNGPDSRYTGKEVCFCYNEDSFTLVDVTDKSNPMMISKRGYEGYAYTHQGWITEDQTVALMDDEQDETRALFDFRTRTYVWDIRDLTNPVLMNTFYSAEEAIDHNQYIVGNLTYQSNYEAGLRILQIDQDNFNLDEVAYFDVLPKPDYDTSFEGSWSNYPYFKSGNVAVSSIEYGLFMVRPNYSQIKADIAAGNYGEQTRSREVVSGDNDATCPAVMQKRQCDPAPCM